MKQATLPVRDPWMEPGPAPTPRLQVVSDEGDELFHPERSLVQTEGGKMTPWARGIHPLELKQEEWRLVRGAPLLSFLLVAGADGQVQRWERRALVHALEEGRRSSCEVFRLVCQELFQMRGRLLEQLVADSLEVEQLPEAYQVVAWRLSHHEAERFKWCLLEVGRRVAVASGGLLAPWGWLRREERHALAELAWVLDTAATRRPERSTHQGDDLAE